MPRPQIHKTPAERQAAYRARTKPVNLTNRQAETVDEIAAQLDTSRNEIVHSMIQFALMNRNWKQLGLFGTRSWNSPGSEQRPRAYVSTKETATD